MFTIALGGNPNCGKSALFNALTGIRQKTGNWPGVTVDRKEGKFSLDNEDVKVIDLPGIYSLDASSIDEEVTRDYLLSRDAGLVVNVVDASNLERNLYFSVQLREMGVPLVIALNMMDVARKRGIQIDIKALGEALGCPIVPVVAVTGEGLDQLKQVIDKHRKQGLGGSFQVTHGEVIEEAITEIQSSLPSVEHSANARWLAIKLLENDSYAFDQAGEQIRPLVERWQQNIEQRTGEDADIHIADARYSHAHTLSQQTMRQQGKAGRTLSDRIDKVVLNRIVGIPIFLLVMYIMFMFTINVGGAFIDFFDLGVGAITVDGFSFILTNMGAPNWMVVLLANGIGGGIQVVSTFIPIIACLYLFLSILEDTGYMARAAFVMDRAMRAIGLPGKAFVPLIVGFGCNVPAIMATRTLENERERKLTILMNPFMSCGARLPVYALFAAAFFPSNGQNLVFLLYLIGIAVAILTGMIMRRTLLSGESTGFIMELPPYHMPTLKGISLRTWDRVKLFIRDAGKVIVLMVLALNVLNSIGTDGSFGNEDSKESILSITGKAVTPLFAPLGIEENNWPATVGIFTGVLAKEAVVGTLDSLYTQLAIEDAGGEIDEEPFDLWRSLERAVATIPDNFSGLTDFIFDPLGMDVGDTSSIEAAAEAQEVSTGMFGAMASRFDGQAGAFAYLLFILLYFPCVATIGAIARETGGTWALFVAGWTTGVAYTTSTFYYQIATFSNHPNSSAAWIVGLLLLSIGIFLSLRSWGRAPSAAMPAEGKA
ncbi:MAG: Fe(2+) transporter permease subunit FeoB [Gammaproteobacteria bacterium]|nr:Fe(2+) transporter permease subunit FeoB [Gammaproteobacteria bacterium]